MVANKGASGELRVAKLVMEFLRQPEARVEATQQQPHAMSAEEERKKSARLIV